MTEAVEKKTVCIVGADLINGIPDLQDRLKSFNPLTFRLDKRDRFLDRLIRHTAPPRHILINGLYIGKDFLKKGLSGGDRVVYINPPTLAYKNDELNHLRTQGVDVLDLVVLPFHDSQTRHVLVGGSQEGYLDMINLFKSLSSKDGSCQLIGKMGAASEAQYLIRLGSKEIKQILLGDPYNCYPNIVERILDNHFTT